MGDSGRFDSQEFNAAFEKSIETQKAKTRDIDREKLNKMSTEEIVKPVSSLSIFEIIVGIKDTWFGLIDDLLQRRFTMVTFTKNNRLFFIGTTIILIIITLYLYDIFVNEADVEVHKKVVEVVHRYKITDGLDKNLAFKLANADAGIVGEAVENAAVFSAPDTEIS
jgi:hypothetical protein